MAKPKPQRRQFLATSAAGAAMTLPAASYNKVYGANERMGVAFIGVGGRCQAHLSVVKDLAAGGAFISPADD